MNNKLHLVQKTCRLNRVWMAAGDARMPLACVWIAAGMPGASPVPSNFEEVRRHLCA
jgi:hypothetical protein